MLTNFSHKNFFKNFEIKKCSHFRNPLFRAYSKFVFFLNKVKKKKVFKTIYFLNDLDPTYPYFYKVLSALICSIKA